MADRQLPHPRGEHRQVRRDLPRSYFDELPKLGPGFLAGHPRIFAIIWAYVAHTDSLFKPEQLASYIKSYERRKALTLGELWAVAINLRILLIENARRQAELLDRATRDRRQADQLADRLLGINGPAAASFTTTLLPREQSGLTSRAFIVQLLRRLSGQTIEGLDGWLGDQLSQLGGSAEAVIQSDLGAQSVATVSMRNIFHSLRLVNDVNWEDWLESVSAIEAELRTHPGYRELDFTTRNSYRSAIERIARRSDQEELDVARAALFVANQSPDEVGRDIGFWLIDDGVDHFERQLGYRPTWHERRVRLVKAMGLPGYLGGLVLATGLVVGLLLWAVHALTGGLAVVTMVVPDSGQPPGQRTGAGASQLRHPRLPTTRGPDSSCQRRAQALRTLVVVPTMITSSDGIEELIDNLECTSANDDGEIYFAAARWADAASEHTASDAELLNQARHPVLNEKYGERFFLFHGSGAGTPARVWMGWERKRGKLMELNAYLRGATDTSYIAFEGRMRPDPLRDHLTPTPGYPRDTPGSWSARSPTRNRPVVDPKTGRVSRGFSVLQPRVTPSLPSIDDTSFFQSVYSTQRGLTPYSVAISDVYQDLFGRGSFSGKGIYEIDALEAALDDRIPENTVLSHDLLEGNYARSGLVTDVEVVEEYPTSYEVDTKRQHRWIRGDWQLLPWIFGRRRSQMDGLAIWKMLDNLRRSLVPIFAVVGFIVTLALSNWQPAACWLLLLVAQLLLPSLIGIVSALFAPARGITLRSKYHTIGTNLVHALRLAALNFIFLAHKAWSNADAIIRTWWRMVISRRHSLEWTTAAASARQASGTWRDSCSKWPAGWCRRWLHWWSQRSVGRDSCGVLPAAVLWLIAPLVAQRSSARLDRVELQADPGDLLELRLVARRTWGFFETFVTAEQSHLPPDNFQEDRSRRSPAAPRRPTSDCTS